MGTIMAIGVALANSILLVTFAEQARRRGASAADAARGGAQSRLRPILMTSCAMLAGMLPMALALGEGGQQTAPLGRAVIGGLACATLATLFVTPAVFALLRGRAGRQSASLDPNDPDSPRYDPSGNGRAGGGAVGEGEMYASGLILRRGRLGTAWLSAAGLTLLAGCLPLLAAGCGQARSAERDRGRCGGLARRPWPWDGRCGKR